MPRHSEVDPRRHQTRGRHRRVGRRIPALASRRFQVQGAVSVPRRPQSLARAEPRAPVVQVLELRRRGRRLRFRQGLRTRRFPRGAAHVGRTGRDRSGERRPPGRRRGGPRRPSCSRSTPGPSGRSPRRWRGSPEALAYVEGRGITRASVERFRLGYAPDARDWLTPGPGSRVMAPSCWSGRAWSSGRPRRPGPVRERFRGRLIFPIHDVRGRTLGFGGRILPAVERALAAAGEDMSPST